MRVTRQPGRSIVGLRSQANVHQGLQHALASLFGIEPRVVNAQPLAHDLLNGHAWRQGRERVLKNHLNALAKRAGSTLLVSRRPIGARHLQFAAVRQQTQRSQG